MSRTEVRYGPRLGREGKVRLGCSAVVFDESREKVLLTRRADNGLWCLPGGAQDAGESTAEACVREVLEETGLEVRVVRLIGVYNNPDQLVVYPDGNRAFIVALSFEAEVTGGELGLSNETTEVRYFRLEEMEDLPMMGEHCKRVVDAFLNRPEAFFS